MPRKRNPAPAPDQLSFAEPAPASTVTYKPVPGFPAYRVGSNGDVQSRWSRYHRQPRLTDEWRSLQHTATHRSPYKSINLSDGKRNVTKRAHELVLELFVGPRPLGMVACHNDGNSRNNDVSNLRWDTPAANEADKVRHGTIKRGSRHYLAKLTEDDVRRLRAEVSRGIPAQRLANMYGIDPGTAVGIAAFKSWKHVKDYSVGEKLPPLVEVVAEGSGWRIAVDGVTVGPTWSRDNIATVDMWLRAALTNLLAALGAPDETEGSE